MAAPDYTKGSKAILEELLSRIQHVVQGAEQFAADRLPAAAAPYLPHVRRAGNVILPLGLAAGVGQAYRDVYLKNDPYEGLPAAVRAHAEAFDKRVASIIQDKLTEKAAAVPLQDVQQHVNPGIRRMLAAPALAYVSYALAKDLLNHRKRQAMLDAGAGDPSSNLEAAYTIY